MHTKAFLACMVCLFVGLLPLQAADFGIRGGLNFASAPSQDEFSLFSAGSSDHRLEIPGSNHTGFHFGVFANFSFANVFVQPEFLFEETGQEMVLVTDDQTMETPELNRFTPRFSNIKIPITAGIQIAFLRVGAGPYYAYMLDNTRGYMDLIDMDDRITFHYNESRMGYQVMAGIRIGNISLDYRFEGSISRLGDGIDVGGVPYDFSVKQRQHVISLGIAVF